jgi:uncharacterized protein RhaS with RHS repeats
LFVAEDPIGIAGGPNLYAYVGGNPLRFVDPLGLTEQDITLMRQLADVTQLDLNVGDKIFTKDLGHDIYGGEVLGYTDPLSKNIWVDDKYLGCLTCQELEELYETITHEAIHRTGPRWDMLRRPSRHQDIYDEARRRTDPHRDLIRSFCRQK